VFVGFLFLFVPGVALLVLFWPFYYLLIDQRTGLSDSFSMAYKIGSINLLTTIVLVLLSIAISIIGLLACGVGLILAIPLNMVIWVVAYLMMSGQIACK
jgi:uncharacterized membrane protein